jgi:hypothetical protein
MEILSLSIVVLVLGAFSLYISVKVNRLERVAITNDSYGYESLKDTVRENRKIASRTESIVLRSDEYKAKQAKNKIAEAKAIIAKLEK